MTESVLEQAIKRLAQSLTPISGVANPIDKSKAIGLFKALLSHGHALTYHPIYDILVECGWPSDQASDAADLAEAVAVDRYIEQVYPTDWGLRVVQSILAINPEAAD